GPGNHRVEGDVFEGDGVVRRGQGDLRVTHAGGEGEPLGDAEVEPEGRAIAPAVLEVEGLSRRDLQVVELVPGEDRRPPQVEVLGRNDVEIECGGDRPLVQGPDAGAAELEVVRSLQVAPLDADHLVQAPLEADFVTLPVRTLDRVGDRADGDVVVSERRNP